MRTAEETIDYIVKLASDKGITQRELAEKVGVSEAAMSRYVNHSREFPINDIGKYAQVLGTTVVDLLGIKIKNSETIFTTLETLVLSIQGVGALNEDTINNPVFLKRLTEAMLQDLRKLIQE